MEQWSARFAHNEQVTGSSPVPATTLSSMGLLPGRQRRKSGTHSWAQNKKTNMISTRKRIQYAKWLLYGSIFGMIINVGLYLFKVIDESDLILVTLILSWLAITLTAIDILSTQDVRDKQ